MIPPFAAVRAHTGRALIRAARYLSRAGARLLGHPCAQPERVERPPLRLVADEPVQLFDCRHHR